MEEGKLLFSLLAADSEVGKMKAMEECCVSVCLCVCLSLELVPDGEGQCGKGGRRNVGPGPLQPSAVMGKEGAGLVRPGPSFSITVTEQSRDIYVNRAQTSYMSNNKKDAFQGEVGQENQTLCVQLNIFSNFIL